MLNQTDLKGEVSGDLKGDPQNEIVPDVNIIRSKVSESGTNHKHLVGKSNS